MIAPRIKKALLLKRAAGLVWRSAPRWTVASVALVLVQGVLPLLSLFLLKLVVDAIAAGLSAPGRAVAFGRVAVLIGLAGVVALLGALCRLLAGLVSEAQAQVVADQVYEALHAKSLEVDLEYYENSQYYDALYRAQEEAPYRPTKIVNGLAQLALSGISLLAIAGLLLSLHWWMMVVLLVAAVPGVVIRLQYAGRLYQWKRAQTLKERTAGYFHWMMTSDVYAKEFRLFGLGPLFRRRFSELRGQLRRERLRIAARRSMIELATHSGAVLAVFGSFAFVAYRALQGAITLGDLVMFYQAFQRGQEFLQQLMGSLAGLYEDNLFLTNFYEFLDLKPGVVEPAQPKPIPRPMRSGIVFDRVSFRYPRGTRDALQDVSLTIRPGEVVALVGENGTGKTTLVKLLCRLYDPTAGAIKIDGRDLREFETAFWRREISVVFQDYARYHLSAQENIWLGNISLPPDPERIEATARQVGVHEVISRLPRGYETTLGKLFEDGEELSIGEWQKVALARALLREAQIIVLDEPSSALDAKAEYEVFKHFRQLAADRTAIVISHRLSTVKMADYIYVLGGGKIVESGTHHELVHHGGTYAGLFERQAQYYR